MADGPGLALETAGLSKTFKVGFRGRTTRSALRDLSLTVSRGEIFGYLGPNGSGKTTTLKILMRLIAPDKGTAFVLGSPLADRSWRHRVGYQPEQPYFYDYLSAEEYLDYVGRLFGLSSGKRRERCRQLLALVGLERAAGMPLRRYSKGMIQRLGLAQALVNDPDLLFLDEPMSGLDPIGRRRVRDLILELKGQGKTVFFSTHILADAEMLCDRVALLRAGTLVQVGRLDEILGGVTSRVEILVSALPSEVVEALPGTHATRPIGERWRLEVEEDQLASVAEAVRAAGGRILFVQPVRESLEDYFLEKMGMKDPEGQWTLDR